jgi:hypothetical protein
VATPPLPEVPCVRVAVDYQDNSNLRSGGRFYLSYSGSAPTAGNCATLASDVASAWATNICDLFTNNWALVEVDVLDIATDSGASGQWTGTNTGTLSGTSLPSQCASNIEFGIARRYRGGKPRMYLPPGGDSQLLNASTYTSSFVTALHTGMAAAMAAIEALSIGSMGTLQHVNVSFYQGYRTRTTGGGQTTFAPKYRSPTALVDDINSYIAKATVGSQRRRRTSTTY